MVYLSPSQLFQITIFENKKAKTAQIPTVIRPAIGTPELAIMSQSAGILTALYYDFCKQKNENG